MSKNSKSIIEGLLFAAGEDGLRNKDLTTILDMSIQDVQDAIDELSIEMKEQGRGIQILQFADRFQLTTLPEHSVFLSKLNQVPTRAFLTRAALETLSIIAYKQPITRLEIEEIRGVKSERIIQLLQRKGLIKDAGRSNTLGRPILYQTTDEFLNYFGLNQIDDLPSPKALFNEEAIDEDKITLFKKLGMEKQSI